MKACKDFASAYFETLIHEPAWLEARSSVIMMALKTIDEGKIPSEEEIYKAVLAWARHSSPEQLERMSSSSDGDNTATVMQYLADTDELVDDHPSFSSVNSAQDASSSNEHLQDETIETEIKDKADAYPVYRPLAAGREADLAVILSYVRFPLIRPAFLAQVVEQDPYVMELEGVHDLVSTSLFRKTLRYTEDTRSCLRLTDIMQLGTPAGESLLDVDPAVTCAKNKIKGCCRVPRM